MHAATAGTRVSISRDVGTSSAVSVSVTGRLVAHVGGSNWPTRLRRRDEAAAVAVALLGEGAEGPLAGLLERDVGDVDDLAAVGVVGGGLAPGRRPRSRGTRSGPGRGRWRGPGGSWARRRWRPRRPVIDSWPRVKTPKEKRFSPRRRTRAAGVTTGPPPSRPRGPAPEGGRRRRGSRMPAGAGREADSGESPSPSPSPPQATSSVAASATAISRASGSAFAAG